ncbi:PHP domain-containing protein [Calderihabitans maritimus]|uniref:Polymerase/histidinol phosphatase N-terminal domain-containing protein n=1 Tax=Calderihabitans maritimus TaxID=1246530 RepID=A0A1Z5HPT2_9FIRM|nr:PHP domain-containing protein [Calderihabitans maritimus]GAW91533.1 hypothetical protein KKC1_06940 [Calderihabitans maritimus]
MGTVDLHVHTTASDGTMTPTEVVEEALKLGLRGIAITDHDTTEGIEEACQAASGKSLLVIPGVEISTEWQEREVHLLGYWIDFKQEWFQAQLRVIREGRERRIKAMVQKLNSLGYPVSYSRVEELAGEGSIGRPHVAQALVEKGYVADIGEAFEIFIGKGRPAYVPRMKLEPQEAVRLIIRAGGVPVLAHPGLIGDDALIPPLLEAGLRGLEASYPEHSPETESHYRELAAKYGLIATGGSDFHGYLRGCHLGESGVPYKIIKVLEELKEMS